MTRLRPWWLNGAIFLASLIAIVVLLILAIEVPKELWLALGTGLGWAAPQPGKKRE